MGMIILLQIGNGMEVFFFNLKIFMRNNATNMFEGRVFWSHDIRSDNRLHFTNLIVKLFCCAIVFFF